MRERRRPIYLLALCLFAALIGSAGLVVGPAHADSPDEYVVVKYAGGARESQRKDGQPPTLREQGFRRIAVPKGKSSTQFVAELRAQGNVESASADGRVTAADIPNDPYYALGVGVTQAQYLAPIHAPEAWDIETGNNTVIVAVLDTGLDLGHPEFAGHIWENPDDRFSDGVDHDNNGCINDRFGCRFINLTQSRAAICGYSNATGTGNTPSGNVSDDHGTGAARIGSHGTLAAGIIGASGNNALGITGIAWNVRIMPIKVLDCGTGSQGQPQGDVSNVAQAIEYARKNGANIISLSLATHTDQADLRAAVKAASDAGIIVVASAGNYGQDPNPAVGYPAAYTDLPNVVAVGASDNLNGNTWARYSAYGPAIDFAAPGNHIVSTARSNIGLSSPYADTGNEGGTSFSAPIVSGMFALMMMRNSKLGAGDYIQYARDAATPAEPAPHGGNWAGAGIIDIGGAVARVPMQVSGIALKDWRDVPNGTDVRATIGGVDCGSTKVASFGPVSPYTIRVVSAAERPGCGAPGKIVQFSVGGLPAVPTITWGGRNADLGLLGREISSVSPPPGAVVVQTLNGSWSNIAQFDPGGALPQALSSIPTPWTALYLWDPLKPILETTGAYRRFLRGAPAYVNDVVFIDQYQPFWINAPASNPGSPNPNPPPGRVQNLRTGWNNFVYTGSNKSVADALTEVAGKFSEVAQFDNATSTWLIYTPNQARYLNDFGGLFKLKVYWIYMTSPGSITMN
ncbi:MAG: S8 family serine peptidase [Tepidiformaceae bacterium]